MPSRYPLVVTATATTIVPAPSRLPQPVLKPTKPKTTVREDGQLGLRRHAVDTAATVKENEDDSESKNRELGKAGRRRRSSIRESLALVRRRPLGKEDDDEVYRVRMTDFPVEWR
jgi:hypothetical protein